MAKTAPLALGVRGGSSEGLNRIRAEYSEPFAALGKCVFSRKQLDQHFIVYHHSSEADASPLKVGTPNPLPLCHKSLEGMRGSGPDARCPPLLEGLAICPLAPAHQSGTGGWREGNRAGNVSKQMRADCGLGTFLG